MAVFEGRGRNVPRAGAPSRGGEGGSQEGNGAFAKTSRGADDGGLRGALRVADVVADRQDRHTLYTRGVHGRLSAEHDDLSPRRPTRAAVRRQGGRRWPEVPRGEELAGAAAGSTAAHADGG